MHNKRFYTLKNTNFDFKINSDLTNTQIKNHPIIIFYDDASNKVFYLVSKTYDKKYDDLIKSQRYVLIKPNKKYDYIKQDTVVDTTTIYSMDRNDFIKEFKIDPSLKYLLIPINQQFEILSLLIKNYDDNHIAYKEIKKFNPNLNQLINTTTYYASNQWILQEVRNKFYKHPQILKKHIKAINSNTNKLNIFMYIHNQNNQIQVVLKPKSYLGMIISMGVEMFNDDNQLDIYDPYYIDATQLKLRWGYSKSNQKQKKPPLILV